MPYSQYEFEANITAIPIFCPSSNAAAEEDLTPMPNPELLDISGNCITTSTHSSSVMKRMGSSSSEGSANKKARSEFKKTPTEVLLERQVKVSEVQAEHMKGIKDVLVAFLHQNRKGELVDKGIQCNLME